MFIDRRGRHRVAYTTRLRAIIQRGSKSLCYVFLFFYRLVKTVFSFIFHRRREKKITTARPAAVNTSCSKDARSSRSLKNGRRRDVGACEIRLDERCDARSSRSAGARRAKSVPPWRLSPGVHRKSKTVPSWLLARNEFHFTLTKQNRTRPK